MSPADAKLAKEQELAFSKGKQFYADSGFRINPSKRMMGSPARS
jgi:hypothetical protein